MALVELSKGPKLGMLSMAYCAIIGDSLLERKIIFGPTPRKGDLVDDPDLGQVIVLDVHEGALIGMSGSGTAMEDVFVERLKG
jgi:hypothetical protein